MVMTLSTKRIPRSMILDTGTIKSRCSLWPRGRQSFTGHACHLTEDSLPLVHGLDCSLSALCPERRPCWMPQVPQQETEAQRHRVEIFHS